MSAANISPKFYDNTEMSQYPPPPPPDQSHYTPVYPAGPNTQLLDSNQQEQLPYNIAPAQQLYSKIEPSLADSNQAHHNPLIDPRTPLQPAAVPPPAAGADPQHQKSNRLRKACDSCSIRKVKCDESGPPCRACAALDIPCTFDRPSRRRGPPNRHAEAIKKRRIESPTISGASIPSSPTHAAQALASLSSHPPLSAESICPLDVVEPLINDFFTYIHPLCPFPHEAWFRDAFAKREDYSNRRFLALMASMIAALVASFPRKPREHLKAHGKEHLFPNHMALVNQCQQVCYAARGIAYLDIGELTVYDACTSYFIGLSYGYTYRWEQSRLYFSESVAIMRSLGLHKVTKSNFVGDANGSANNRSRVPVLDKITEQMGRRLFWTIFVGARTMQQWGSTYADCMFHPPTPSEPYPPLPEDVDDFNIYPSHVEKQQEGTLSIMAGFLANVQVFKSYTPLSAMEMAYGAGEVFDWERQKRLLEQCIRACKDVTKNLPTELTVWSGEPNAAAPDQSYYPPGHGYEDNPRGPALENPYTAQDSPEERRRVQFEIQKANIYASWLSTRSYLVEKFFHMSEAQSRKQAQNAAHSSPGVISSGLDSMISQQQPRQTGSEYDKMEEEMSLEREAIIKDLLVVLQNINQASMEPNGVSIISKIRLVASTLLDVPRTRKSSVSVQAESYLMTFLDILGKLERMPSADSDPNRFRDEEGELKHWSDLREYQLKFQEAGGIAGICHPELL